MVLAAKALLDGQPDPTEEQVRDRESWFKQTGTRWWLLLAIDEATGQGAGFTEITYDTGMNDDMFTQRALEHGP